MDRSHQSRVQRLPLIYLTSSCSSPFDVHHTAGCADSANIEFLEHVVWKTASAIPVGGWLYSHLISCRTISCHITVSGYCIKPPLHFTACVLLNCKYSAEANLISEDVAVKIFQHNLQKRFSFTFFIAYSVELSSHDLLEQLTWMTGQGSPNMGRYKDHVKYIPNEEKSILQLLLNCDTLSDPKI